MANAIGTADHEAAQPDALPGLTVERTKAIVLLLVQLFSLVQTGLSIAGVSALPLTTDQVSTAITGVVAVVASIWAWWRNNNLTRAAVQGQQVTDAIRLAARAGAADHPSDDGLQPDGGSIQSSGSAASEARR